MAKCYRRIIYFNKLVCIFHSSRRNFLSSRTLNMAHNMVGIISFLFKLKFIPTKILAFNDIANAAIFKQSFVINY